jgi:hypothetical protein
MATFGESLAAASKFLGAAIDIVDTRNSKKRQESLESQLAITRAETDRLRSQAEADAQANALMAQGDMQANLQKWLTWSIGGLVVIGGGVVLGRMLFKRGG